MLKSNKENKRPLTSYLKLLKHFMSKDTFVGEPKHSPYEMIDNTNNHFSNGKVQVHRRYHYTNTYKSVRRNKYVDEIQYSTGRVYFIDDMCKIECTIFSNGLYKLEISTEFESKDEFFNYIIENNTDYLTYEDYKVLQEIKQLTIQIINKGRQI